MGGGEPGLLSLKEGKAFSGQLCPGAKSTWRDNTKVPHAPFQRWAERPQAGSEEPVKLPWEAQFAWGGGGSTAGLGAGGEAE